MTAKYQIIYWRDIPTQVKVRSATARVTRELSARFQQVIDAAAMSSGVTGTDDYLSNWRTSEWHPAEGPPESVADDIIAKLEDDYPPQRLSELARRGGHASTE